MVMATFELAGRLYPSEVTVNALHPGSLHPPGGKGVRWVAGISTSSHRRAFLHRSPAPPLDDRLQRVEPVG